MRFLALFFLSVFAHAEECALEGSGTIDVTCASDDGRLSLQLGGMDAPSIDTIRVRVGDERLDSDSARVPERYATERVEEGTFVFYAVLNATLVQLVGVPNTFQIRSDGHDHGSVRLSGTFGARLSAGLGDDVFDAPVRCEVAVVDCPRKGFP